MHRWRDDIPGCKVSEKLWHDNEITRDHFRNYDWHFFCFLQPCVIADCGEHKDGDSWGAAPNDGSGDTHPDFPEDSDINLKDVSICQVFDLQGYGWTLADHTALRVSDEGPLRVFRKCACLSSYLKAEKTHIHFRTKSQDMFYLANTLNRVNLLLNKFKGQGALNYLQYFVSCTLNLKTVLLTFFLPSGLRTFSSITVFSGLVTTLSTLS